MIDNDNNLYAENLRQIERRSANYLKTSDSSSWEASWLYDFIPYQDDEKVRACAVLPMIKFELQQNNISDEMLGELGYYYDEVFINKTFDGIFNDPDERKMYIKDLQWCYDTAKQKGLID